MGHSRPPLLYFRLFSTVDSKQMFDKSLPMPGFEPQISGVGGDRSTTEPQPLPYKGQLIPTGTTHLTAQQRYNNGPCYKAIATVK